MAALPPISGLTMEAIVKPDGSLDPEKFVQSLNQFMGGTHAALNKQLTFAANFPMTVKDVRLTMPAAPPYVAFTYAANYSHFDSTAWELGGYLMQPGGLVKIKGMVKSATVIGTVTTLPAGYRPPLAVRLDGDSNGAYARGTVNADGTVVQDSGAAAWFSIASEFYATTPAAPTAWTTTGWPIRVQHGLSRCTGVVVAACTLKDGKPAESGGQVSLDWEDTGGGEIRIKSAWGLTWARTYTLRLLMLSE